MTKKARAKAVTEFLMPILKEAANRFIELDGTEQSEEKSNELAKVIVIKDLLEILNDGNRTKSTGK